MGFGEVWFWPFAAAFVGIWVIFAILFIAFWIWMIVDVAKREFKEKNEKILWILVVILGSWVGALVYYIVVRMYNPKGLIGK